jgi:hypothetical protein
MDSFIGGLAGLAKFFLVCGESIMDMLQSRIARASPIFIKAICKEKTEQVSRRGYQNYIQAAALYTRRREKGEEMNIKMWLHFEMTFIH